MTHEEEVGCARPTGGPVDDEPDAQTQDHQTPKENSLMITIGQKAPDFVAPGYQQGKFINVKLSDYIGRWVSLCFYPGDFTFV